MTKAANKIENVGFTLIESPVVDVSTPMDLEDIDAVKAHCFAGVRFFSDAAGEVDAAPTEGTIVILVQTLNNEPNFEDPPDLDITAATPMTVTWDANTKVVRATPSGIVGAAYYKLIVTCNET